MKIPDTLHIIESQDDAAKSEVVAHWAFVAKVDGKPEILMMTEVLPSTNKTTINLRVRKYQLTEVST